MSVFCQSFDLELFSHWEERVELLLRHIHLPLVHKIQDWRHIGPVNSPEENEWMRMLVLTKDLPEDGGAGGEDHAVSLERALVTGQGHIKQLLVAPQLLEGCDEAGLIMLPPQAEILHDMDPSHKWLDVYSAVCWVTGIGKYPLDSLNKLLGWQCVGLWGSSCKFLWFHWSRAWARNHLGCCRHPGHGVWASEEHTRHSAVSQQPGRAAGPLPSWSLPWPGGGGRNEISLDHPLHLLSSENTEHQYWGSDKCIFMSIWAVKGWKEQNGRGWK